MQLAKTLGLQPGVTALLGSGGKTTLLLRLAQELPGRVIVTTSTKIYPPTQFPVANPQTEQELQHVLDATPKCCIGAPLGEKLTSGALPISVLRRSCTYLLVEADGSRHLPLKAHGPGEPVIPAETAQRILLVGLSGVGRPIQAAAHRPERFAALAGCTTADAATPARIARVLLAERLFDCVVLNQADGREKIARELAALLPAPVFAGEVREGRLECL